jgi:hypothetical protein
MYNLFFILMLIGYGGLTFCANDLKSKIIGGLLLLANFLIFYK